MILRLSHPHGAVLTKNAKTKIAVAAERKTISSDSLPPHRIPVSQTRWMHKPIITKTSGIKMPKFENQNEKNGPAKSSSLCTQPGCHSRTDPARKWSVINQTKKVAGRKALARSVTTRLRVCASPVINKEAKTMLRARNVCTWKNGIEAYNESSTQNGSGARCRSCARFLENFSRQSKSSSNPAGIA